MEGRTDRDTHSPTNHSVRQRRGQCRHELDHDKTLSSWGGVGAQLHACGCGRRRRSQPLKPARSRSGTRLAGGTAGDCHQRAVHLGGGGGPPAEAATVGAARVPHPTLLPGRGCPTSPLRWASHSGRREGGGGAQRPRSNRDRCSTRAVAPVWECRWRWLGGCHYTRGHSHARWNASTDGGVACIRFQQNKLSQGNKKSQRLMWGGHVEYACGGTEPLGKTPR